MALVSLPPSLPPSLTSFPPHLPFFCPFRLILPRASLPRASLSHPSLTDPPSLSSSCLPIRPPQDLPPTDLVENRILLDAFAVIAQGAARNGHERLFQSAVDLLIDVFVAYDW